MRAVKIGEGAIMGLALEIGRRRGVEIRSRQIAVLAEAIEIVLAAMRRADKRGQHEDPND
jgi:hypothetical protein